MTEPELVTLDIAIKPYKGVSRSMARKWIREGRLPATKIGRAYLVSPADLASLLRPTLRQPSKGERKKRETETERAERQLAKAGLR